jgi:hypothetical protein
MGRLNWHFGFVELLFARSINWAGIPLTNIAQVLPRRVHFAAFAQVWIMGIRIS